MKQRTPFIRTVIGSLLAGTVLAASSVGIANARPDRDCAQRDGVEPMALHKQAKGKAPFERMLRGLDLSAEQRAQVEQIVAERRTATQNARGAGRENHKALHELATSTAYDPQRAQALADAQARLHADRIVARTETFHRVYQVLTPEQQAKLAELRSAREAKWAERRRAAD